MQDPVSKLLSDAADLLEKRGMVAYDLGSPEKGFCAIGGLNYAHSGNVFGHNDDRLESACGRLIRAAGIVIISNTQYRRALLFRPVPTAHVRPVWTDRILGVVDWSNDLVSKGKSEEVISAFRRAAAAGSGV